MAETFELIDLDESPEHSLYEAEESPTHWEGLDAWLPEGSWGEI